MDQNNPQKPEGQLDLKMDDQMSKGVHATDVLVVTSEKDMCLNFYVMVGPGQGVVTSRVFLPHSTALRMAEIIQQRIGPAKKLLDEMVKKLPPPSDEGTS